MAMSFSTNLILHNTTVIVIIYFSKETPLNKERVTFIILNTHRSMCSDKCRANEHTDGQKDQPPSQHRSRDPEPMLDLLKRPVCPKKKNLSGKANRLARQKAP